MIDSKRTKGVEKYQYIDWLPWVPEVISSLEGMKLHGEAAALRRKVPGGKRFRLFREIYISLQRASGGRVIDRFVLFQCDIQFLLHNPPTTYGRQLLIYYR